MNVRVGSTFVASWRTAIAGAFLLLGGCTADERPGTPLGPPRPLAYNVGGSVSGLTGSVTLLNNDGDARTVSANGSFTFPTPLAANAAYAVTVQTQPTDQLCTVTNGSGTVGTAPVTNVAVACETVRATGTVGASGGTVTGPDGVQVEIPAGALAQDTVIGIARSSAGAPPPPSDGLQPTALYEFTPHGLVFAKPVTIRMPYTTNGSDPPAPILMASPDEDWQEVNAAFAAGVATFERNSFSWGGQFPCATLATSSNVAVDGCVWVRGGVRLTATPSTALTSMFPGPIGPFFTGPWRVTEASTVRFRFAYVLPSRCIAATVRIKRARANANGFEVPATLVTEGPGSLASDGKAPPAGSVSGSASLDVPFDFAQNGLWFYFLQTICTQGGGVTKLYGEVQAIQVDVPVPTITYPIGGTVSGLAGSGLVLRLNGGSDLAVGADGAFTFGTAIAQGGAYAVTVAAQPTNPAQTCSVASATGTAQGPVTNVNVSCTTVTTSRWRTATLVEAGTRPASDARVGLDDAGNAIVVWKATSSDPDTAIRTTEVWANRYTPANGWGTPTLITRFSDGNVSSLWLAVHANGNAVVVWHDDVNYDVNYATYTPAGGWGAPRTVENRPEEVQELRIASEPSGTIVAAFSQKTGPFGTEDMWAARYVDGIGWSAPVLLEQSERGVGEPRVAVSASGFAMVAWEQEPEGMSASIYSQGGWSTATIVPDTSDFTGDDFEIALDDAGRGVIAYVRTAASGFVKALRFTPDSWRAVDTVRASAASPARLKLAMRGTGEALLLWVEGEGLTDVWAQPYGVLGGTVEKFTAGTGGQQPDVTPLPDGTFLVLYAERANGTMRARRFDPAVGTWPADEVVATGVQGFEPRVAADPAGRAVGVWTQSDDARGSDIAANVYR